MERLRTLASRQRLPTLIHAQGDKPWRGVEIMPDASPTSARARFRSFYTSLHLEVSPYTAAAREYRNDLGEEATWLDPHTRIGRAMAALSRHHPVMQEFPLAVVHSAGRRTVRLLKAH